MDNNQNNQPKIRKPNWGIVFVLIIMCVVLYMLINNAMQPNYTYVSYDIILDMADDGEYTADENGYINSPFSKTKYKKSDIDTFTVSFEELTAIPLGGDNSSNMKLTGIAVEKIQKVGQDKATTQKYYFTCNITSSQYEDLCILTSIQLQKLSSNIWLSLLINLAIPIIAIIIILVIVNRSNGNKQAFDFGKNRARMSRGKTVTFNDVAGCDEEKAELVEVVDFLKNPKKYVEIGARIPKGVLLSGAPGTGKTLLAKAVAGEAGVPFFSISGSDFVEMFVGVGASRVRDLFKDAKENSPCIIFIDEIDAVGRQRGAGIGGGHDEREQTLNQLLVEMDGFSVNQGIIIMAATNRPDVLDPALLRPGRFDRQITIASPDVNGREAILKVHAKNKKFTSDVKFDELAQRIPGFSGADIENLLNEAALLAARDNRKKINKFDLDEATDRVMMGPAKKSRKITDEEKNCVAHHEAGHAVIGLKLKKSNIVQKVTIIPRGQAGGYALMLPEQETYNETKSSLLDRITGYLGGRVAEEIMFGDVSTGAYHDFKMATKIARAMVTEYGMSDLGPVQYESPQGSVFLGRDYTNAKNFSDQVALEIDRETRRIIEECYEKAKVCINENKTLLCTIAEYLKRIETLTKSDIDEINNTGHLMWYDKKHVDNPIIVDGKPVVDSSIFEEEKTSVLTEEIEPVQEQVEDVQDQTEDTLEQTTEISDTNEDKTTDEN